jgi:DNA-binding IclR family transcriptional regulator
MNSTKVIRTSATSSVTSELLQLGSATGVALGLRDIARPFMRELRDKYEERVHLGIVESDRVVYIEKLEPPHQRIGLVTSVGQSMSIHSTALGKTILGEMPETARDPILDRLAFEPKTKATITNDPIL